MRSDPPPLPIADREPMRSDPPPLPIAGREPMRSDPPPLRIAGLDHVVLRCARLDATMAFYVDVLGCTFERELPDLGLHQLRAGSALIDLVPIGSPLGGTEPPDTGRANMAHFCLRIEGPDWEALAAHLHAHDIAFEPPETRYGADGYGPSIYIADPEGNVVELKGDGREDG